MKRVLAFFLSLAALAVASLGIAGAASAFVTQPPSDTGPNGEKTSADFTLTPKKGSFYQGGVVPADWQLNATVAPEDPGYSGPVYPVEQVNLKLPTDMDFHPDPKMPVCTDKMINQNTNLSIEPLAAIAKCPKSVIGNGTAPLYLGHLAKGNGPDLDDPVLIVFNAGRVNGQPKIKIYGYSNGTKVGIYMEGVLKPDGTLSIDVPPLSSESALGILHLNIPAPNPIKFKNVTVKQSVGQDPNYLRAKCSTGEWHMSSQFVLSVRSFPDAIPSTDAYPVDSPDFNTTCEGLPGKPPETGKAKLGKVKVNGKGKAKRGKKQVYKVRVKNAGNAVAKGVVVIAKGKGVKGKTKVKLGKVAAKKGKVAKLKLKFTKRGKSKVTFTVRSNNAGKKKAKKVVRVR